MAIDLTDFEPRIRAHAPEWDALALTVTVKSISPNHGNAMTSAEFESAEWLTTVALWESGELDLDAGRKADGWLIAKHYDLEEVAQLDGVFAEVIALVRVGTLPADALTSWLGRN